MQNLYSMLSLGILGLALAAPTAASAAPITLLSDDFGGTAVDTTKWAPFAAFATGASRNTVSNGKISINAGAAASGYAGITSVASDLNPFDAPLTVDLSGLSLTQSSTTSTTYNTGWFTYGRTSESSIESVTTTSSKAAQYRSGTQSSIEYGLSVSLRYSNNADGSAASYSMVVGQYIGSGTPYSTTLYTMSAIPSDLNIVIDGTGSSSTLGLTLSGAQFTGATPSSSLNITLAGTFTEENLSLPDDGPLAARMAVGATNGSVVGNAVNTVLGIDSINVTTVPEPALLGFIAGAGLLLGGRRRRST